MNKFRCYYFKHVWTGITVQIVINCDIKINQLKNIINDKIIRKLKVNNDYEIIIVGQDLQELADPINLESINKLRSIKNELFYIRPINEPIPRDILMRESRSTTNLINLTNLECVICYQNYSLNNYLSWINCSHFSSCCQSCITSWSNECLLRNLDSSCPICRRNFI